MADDEHGTNHRTSHVECDWARAEDAGHNMLARCEAPQVLRLNRQSAGLAVPAVAGPMRSQFTRKKLDWQSRSKDIPRGDQTPTACAAEQR